MPGDLLRPEARSQRCERCFADARAGLCEIFVMLVMNLNSSEIIREFELFKDKSNLLR